MILPSWVAKYTMLQFEDFDCWQLVRKIYNKEFGIILPSYKLDYNGPADLKNIQRLCHDECKTGWKQLEREKDIALGDLLLFRLSSVPCHLAMCVDATKKLMIHTMRDINVVVEDFSQPMWTNKIVGYFTYEG